MNTTESTNENTKKLITQKKYLVPMWNYKNHKMKDHLALINAQDKYQAMLIAIGSHNWSPADENGYSTELPKDEQWHVDMNYEAYQEFNENDDLSCLFTYMDISGRIKPEVKILIKPLENLSEQKSEMEDDENMELYDYMYWGDYNAQIQTLAEKALPERWSFEGRDDNYILKNYLKYTFIKLQNEGKIIETDTYCVFNTGLFSHYSVPIYAYGELNKNRADNYPKWYFKGFKDEYELGKLDLETDFPERVDYFSDPQRFIFNWHNKVIINNKHILDDLNTHKRLSESIKNSSRPLKDLNGVINAAIQNVIANYKLAVPHYYQDKIQLMIPLSFDNNGTYDVALVLDLLKNGNYLATTCLTMQMAYMKARLIARPESNWLVAENIVSTEEEEKEEEN